MADSALANRIPDRSKLSRAEDALILKLSADGKSQTEIAQLVGCNQSSVSRVLRQFVDTRDIAKRLLHNGAQALAERIVKQADVDQALEVLDRLDVAPKREQSGNRTGIQINIGMPGVPVGVDPVFTGYDNADYRTQIKSEGVTSQALTATVESQTEAKV